MLNINTASERDFRYALGISSKIAQRIVAYRTEHGPFTAVSQLLLAPISQTTYDRIRLLVMVYPSRIVPVAFDAPVSKDSAMSEVVSCVGVVLAGGKSARMGVEKASLRIGGEALLARIVRRLRLALPEVIVVGPLGLQTLVPNTPVFPDETPGAGPLGGLASALAQVKSQHIFVMGCDMPFVEPELVGAMARYAMDHPEADVVAVRAARGVEPLHTVYARSCQVAIRDLLASRDVRSLASLLKRLRVEELPTREVVRCDPAARSAFNANAPEDWREALAIHAQETNTAST